MLMEADCVPCVMFVHMIEKSRPYDSGWESCRQWQPAVILRTFCGIHWCESSHCTSPLRSPLDGRHRSLFIVFYQ